MKLITLVEQYIEYRKSLGEKMQISEESLKLFCRVMGTNVSLSDISSNNVKDFLYNSETITTRWFSKYYALNGFYRYAISRGYVHNSPMPKIVPKRPSYCLPYIYTREELRRIFKCALSYKNKNCGYFDPYMIRVVLILIYSMGLRLSEALSLTINDVNISQKIIMIRETKFYKTRIVPFGPQLAAVITEYMRWRKNQGSPQNKEAPFFIGSHGKPLNTVIMDYIFRRIRISAEIKRDGKARNQPRIHDLRHTFAVHRLTSWYQKKMDVQKLLPVLSTYLGHTKLSATSIYLTMTKDLLHQAGMRFEKYVIGGLK